MIILALLGISIFSALLLAFIGDRRYAPEVNIAGSLLTFVTSLLLALQVYSEGGSIAGSTYFFVDYLNISLVVMTTLVSTTTAIFSRRYMRVEQQHGRVGNIRMRF